MILYYYALVSIVTVVCATVLLCSRVDCDGCLCHCIIMLSCRLYRSLTVQCLVLCKKSRSIQNVHVEYKPVECLTYDDGHSSVVKSHVSLADRCDG